MRILYEDQSVIASVLETTRNTNIICGHDAELLNAATTGAFSFYPATGRGGPRGSG